MSHFTRKLKCAVVLFALLSSQAFAKADHPVDLSGTYKGSFTCNGVTETLGLFGESGKDQIIQVWHNPKNGKIRFFDETFEGTYNGRVLNNLTQSQFKHGNGSADVELVECGTNNENKGFSELFTGRIGPGVTFVGETVVADPSKLMLIGASVIIGKDVPASGRFFSENCTWAYQRINTDKPTIAKCSNDSSNDKLDD